MRFNGFGAEVEPDAPSTTAKGGNWD